MKNIFSAALLLLLLGALSSSTVTAETFIEDFSGDLTNWTAGSHIDTYGLVDGQLFIDGRGHLTGPSGWGVLRFDQTLGSSFTATWETRITYYDYANFVLFADSPWAFHPDWGNSPHGYNAWLDIDDPDYPMIDLSKVVDGVDPGLPGETRNVPLPFDVAQGEWVYWRLEKNLSAIKVFVNDMLLIDTYDDELANANYKLGLSFGEDSQGYIDNLIIHTDRDGDSHTSEFDCNDDDASIFPDAPELCDGKDNDCDGLVPVEESDDDEDGFRGCENDCNDADPNVNPGAYELPGDYVDDNCDGSLGDCDPTAAWRNHGHYVRCVAHETDALIEQGVLTEEEGDVLINAAAQSDVGKK